MASVTLFIRNVPPDTQLAELQHFVEGGFGGWRRVTRWLWRAPRVEGARILVVRDRDTDETEWHGLVTIQPHTAFNSVIAELDGKLLNNNLVQVRRYHKRSPLNDRRLHRNESARFPFGNRRAGERRRKNLEISEQGNHGGIV